MYLKVLTHFLHKRALYEGRGNLIFLTQAFDWTSRSGANSLLSLKKSLAEREGFEPPSPFQVNLISRYAERGDTDNSRQKLTEENNYSLPLVLSVSVSFCLQFFHNSFTVRLIDPFTFTVFRLITNQVSPANLSSLLVFSLDVRLLCKFLKLCLALAQAHLWRAETYPRRMIDLPRTRVKTQ